MTETKMTSLIEKIKKLFEMANRKTNNDGSSNEHEAAQAMRMAQELLVKYNLDLRTIKDAAEKSQTKSPVTGKREQIKVNRSAMYRWQQKLWKAIAEANFCFHWVTKTVEFRWGKDRNVKRHVILGSEANVIAVQMMGEYLTETIERLVLEHFSKSDSLSKSAISWREGCADRLIERIQQKAEAMKNEGVTVEGTACTAIVVQDIAKTEYAANYDGAYGEGAWARKLARDAKWEAGAEQRQKEFEEQQKRDALARQNETPAQKAKREEKEKKEYERWERKWDREQQREAARLDHRAYVAGYRKGSDINLDDQLKKS